MEVIRKMRMKTIAIYAGIALILYFVISSPHNSADLVHNILLWLKSVAISLENFLEGVFK
jgi:hypothetical protein